MKSSKIETMAAANELTENELKALIHKQGLPKIVTDIYDENVLMMYSRRK